MKKIILMCFLMLLFFSCSLVDDVQEVVQKPQNKETVRWIDMDDILDFILFSENNNIELKDVIEHLGEPVYIERIDNGEATIDLYYKFKSKLYPEFDTKYTVDTNRFSYTFGEKNIIETVMIKPEKRETLNIWENVENWVIVSLKNDTFELLLNPDKPNNSDKPNN